jgi:hypothetical protein
LAEGIAMLLFPNFIDRMIGKLKLGPCYGPPDHGLSDDAILLLGKLGGEKFLLVRRIQSLMLGLNIEYEPLSLETLKIGATLDKRVVCELTAEKLVFVIPLNTLEQRAAFFEKLDASAQEALEALRPFRQTSSQCRDFLMISKEGRRAFEFYQPRLDSLKKEQEAQIEADWQNRRAKERARAEESLEMLDFVLRRP